MTLPNYDVTLHDINIGGKGFMYPKQKDEKAPPIEGPTRSDALPATDRSVTGRKRYDFYTNDSFWAQDEFGGGTGQAKFVAADMYSTGLGDGAPDGHFYPARKLRQFYDGGSSYWTIATGSTAYGFNDIATDAIETLTDPSVATTARNLVANGTILSKPEISGAGTLHYCINESGTYKSYRWDLNAANAPVVTTPPGFSPIIMRRWGQYLFCIGRRVIESTSGIRQSAVASTTTGTSFSISLTNAPIPGNLLVLVVKAELSTQTVTTPTGWTAWGTVSDATVGCSIQSFYKTVDSSGTKTVSTTKSGATASRIHLFEIEGIDEDNPINDYATAIDTTSDRDMNSGTIATPSNSSGTSFLLYEGISGTASGSAGSPPANYTLFEDTNFAGVTANSVTLYRADTTDTAVTTSGTFFSTNRTDINLLMSFNSNALTSDLNATTFNYSTDDGNTWRECLNGDSVGIPTPIEAFPADEFLWVTCEDGLYQISLTEQTYVDNVRRVMLGIQGPVDRWHIPFTVTNIGKHMGAYNGIIYTPVGHTLRRYVRNGSGGTVFPPSGWASGAGQMQGMAVAEDGVYFGMGGYLFRYNERGFQCIAKESVAGQFDYLYWWKGRLICKGDPAYYIDFGYPGVNPFFYTTSPSDWTTGYWISSKLDLDKVDAWKLLAEFTIAGEFTDATANGGSITLQYISGDTGLHPEKLLGGDNGDTLPWVTLGTLTANEGNQKRLAQTTPIELRSIYLRAKLIPGSVGIPALESVSINGESLLPRVRRVSMIVALDNDCTNKAGAKMYGDATTVQEAIDYLEALRDPDGTADWVTIGWVGASGTKTMTCIAEQFNDSKVGDDGPFKGYVGTLIARQISGTSVT